MRRYLAVLWALGVSSAAQFSYMTWLGGSGIDQSSSVAADSLGNTYVAGTTYSPDFPATTAPLHVASQRSPKIFVAKFDASGKLVFSQVLGGSGWDVGRAVAVDPAGNVYVTGYTQSLDFPVTANAFQQRVNLSPALDPTYYGQDGFVMKLGPDGTLLYATYLGGTRREFPQAIAVDGAGNAYVTGNTESSDFPTTPGAFQAQLPPPGISQQNGFVAKLDASGSRLIWSTYLAGGGIDLPNAIAVGPDGAPVVAGETASGAFPVKNAVQAAFGGGSNFPISHSDGFATKLTADGSALVYSTYLGGVGGDTVRAVAVDGNNNAYFAGTTNSGAFPAGTPQYPAGSLLFRTTDGGVTMDSPRAGLATSAILALAADPFDSRTVYAGTPEGLYKSVDGGDSWSQTALISVGVGTIAIDPRNSAIVYAASSAVSQLGVQTVTGNHGGLWKSMDGGATFTRLPFGWPAILAENSEAPASYIPTLLIDPQNTQILYALASSGGSQSPIYKSTDGGGTWLQLPGLQSFAPSIDGFVLDPANPSTLYASTATVICCGIGAVVSPGQLFRSNDGGASWKPVATGDYGGLVAGPGILYAGYRYSLDGGVTWANRSSGPGRIVQADAGALWGIDSGGRLTSSTDGGATWNPVGGFPAQPYTAFAITPGAIYLGSSVWNDAFVMGLDPAGAMLYTRYLGGSGFDEAKSLAIDPSGTVYVAGVTASFDFPSVNPLMDFSGGFSSMAAAGSGGGNGFVTALDASGAVTFSTSIGSILSYPGIGIGLDPSGALHVVAATSLYGPKDILIAEISPGGR